MDSYNCTILSNGNVILGTPNIDTDTQYPVITLGYGGRFFVGDAYHPDLLSPHIDALKQILNTGTLADFQNWLVQSIVPSDNYNNYRTSSEICLHAMRAHRLDILESFSQHPYFLGMDETFLSSGEFVENEYLFAWQWALALPHPYNVAMKHYEAIIRMCSAHGQLKLLNWVVKNVPDSHTLDRANQLFRISLESHSYSALQCLCAEFSPKYIPLECKRSLDAWEDALDELSFQLNTDLIELIKLYC